MTALACERNLATLRVVELNAVALQVGKRLGGLAHDSAHDLLVAQPLTDDERVGEV